MELLIVVAIIGVLASVVIITLIGQTDKAADATLKANLRSLVSITSDAVSHDIGYDFTYFCKADASDTEDTANIAYGVKGIMDSVFSSAGLDAGSALNQSFRTDGSSVNMYYVAVDEDGNQQSAATDDTFISHGCASNRGGWVAWGALEQDVDSNSSDTDYFCIDSYGGNSSTAVTQVPRRSSDISISDGRLNCLAINS